MRFERTLQAVAVAALAMIAVLTASVTHAQTPIRVVDQREITLPDMRILSLSPDGSLIAAHDGERMCVYDITTLSEDMCADLTPLDAGVREEDVVWSPDSTKIAIAERSFVVYVDGDLWVMDVASGALTNLTDDGVSGPLPLGDDDRGITEFTLDASPTWLPDGSGITYSRSSWKDGTWLGNTIETVPVGGGEPVELTRVSPDLPGVVYFGMRWSADGSTLYYSVNTVERDDLDNGIWRIDADGTNKSQLLGPDSELGAPVVVGVSPDGGVVLGLYADAAARFGGSGGAVYVLIDTATGETTPVEAQSPGLDSFGPWPASLSPDGRYVLFASNMSDPQFQMFALDIATGDETNVIPDGLPGAMAMTITGGFSWSVTGTVLVNSALDTATLLTVEGGTDMPEILPASPTPVPDDATQATPEAGTFEFPVGMSVIVNDNDVPLRAAPATASTTVTTLHSGQEVRVVGEPVEGDGHLWWPVLVMDTNELGWVRDEFVSPAE